MAVGGGEGGVAVEQHDAARLDHDGRQSRLRRTLDRAGANHRQVGAAILTGFGRLVEQAPRRLSAGEAAQHPVGAGQRLDRKTEPAAHHAGLTDIGHGHGAMHGRRASRIGLLRIRDGNGPQNTRRGQKPGRNLVGGAQGEPLILQKRHHRPKRGVVALPHGRHEARHERRGGRVDGTGVDLGPGHRAGKANLVQAARPQIGQKSAKGLDPVAEAMRSLGHGHRHARHFADQRLGPMGEDRARKRTGAGEKRQHAVQPCGVRNCRSL